ncbi:MAG: phage tail tape measure protein [Duncaniella sp.]|uniref:phage tail tape measure protein n=1 Tax=Duncaniella sp. TaxID=2518496 RepID=UPI0023C581AC|nr:phage tail tape measure protein [Duncaniella sp.]MDE5989098.1 phage tail tape measure protein [Duncaniella sp.]
MAGKGVVSMDVTIIEGKDGLKRLTLDADALRKIMESNIKVAQRFEKKVFGFAALTTGINAVNSAFGQLATMHQSVTGESENFNKAMKAANTMAGKDSTGFKQLKSEVADLAKEIPIARDQLANGLYQTISNGVPENNWIEFLNTSARSAVGGLADINKVVGVTSTLIKNYGLEWSAATDIQDKIQLTAKNGVTSFEQLAQALPRVTGNAATLGVSIDELMGTFATLTGVSGNTAEVSTQLGAIFTALVKPSSEAAEMAAKMGIQFDAAAIQAAGGFQNFLTQLDGSVKAYAQANGVLEQEVYSKLFGSAEAIRALIPLQGELADKFTTNVANMVNSAGTMDAAYADMSSHGEAVNQMLRNQWAAFIDIIAGVTSAAQPYINFTAGLLSTGSSAAILITTFKQLNVQQTLVATRAKLASVAMTTLGLRGKSAAATVRVFSSAMKGGAYSATALKIALRGLLIATGIGAAIAAVTAVIGYFSDTVDGATESVEKLDDATDDYTQAAAAAKVQIDRDVKALGDLIKAKKDTKDAVQRLNETYGEIFGSYKTAGEWYKILTEKSQLYVKQLGYEAQAKALGAKIAEASINKELAAERKAELERAGKHKQTVSNTFTTPSGYNQVVTFEVETEEYKRAKKDMADAAATEAELQKRLDVITKKTGEVSAEINRGLAGANSEVKVSEMTWQQLTDAIDKTEKSLKNTTDTAEIKRLRAYNDQLKARKKVLESMTGLGTQRSNKKKTAVADPKTYEELSTNIEIYKKKLTGADTEEQRVIREKIARWEKAREAIELVQKAAERPATLNTLEDIDREISYQRTLRQKATAENIAGIDAEIKRLEELRGQLERSGFAPTPIADIKTYEQLNRELAYYTALLEKADATQRVTVQKSINDLNELKKAWDYVLDDLKKPGDVSTLNTIEDLDEAISYYQQKQKKASGEEIQNIQRTIDAYDKKRDALQRGIEIPSMQREVAEINKLTGREYKVKISGMGFDELTAKINELNRLLNDIDHPVTATQRKDIESLIATYEKWRKEGINAFGTFREGWDGIKGIGSGVESITDALEGNGNAWQTVTGIVDGFLQIYDGIKTIVDIINMLSTATTAHTTAKAAESAAISVATGAQTAEAVAAEANALAQIPVIAANKLATASYMELAAAAYFAAHASIPFAGFGIASGFVTAATAMVQAIGVMPFANGGIVSGPTVGLIGEYAGASNNPEVVAPLDKLRGMLRPTEGVSGGVVKFKIDGRTLVGILEKENNLKHRS